MAKTNKTNKLRRNMDFHGEEANSNWTPRPALKNLRSDRAYSFSVNNPYSQTVDK